jgi:hypothetical protein
MPLIAVIYILIAISFATMHFLIQKHVPSAHEIVIFAVAFLLLKVIYWVIYFLRWKSNGKSGSDVKSRVELGGFLIAMFFALQLGGDLSAILGYKTFASLLAIAVVGTTLLLFAVLKIVHRSK